MRRVVLLLLGIGQTRGFFDRIQKDFAALNMRATARHILQPDTEAGRLECVKIVRDLRAAEAAGVFVVDAFASAAAELSDDAETRGAGGLLGEQLPQGAVRAAALDRACFTAPLGRVIGPIKSEYGLHVVLVEERLGCRFDEGNTRVVAVPMPDEGGAPEGGGTAPPRVRSVLAPPKGGGGVLKFQAGAAAATGATWVAVIFAGGLVAELAANVGAAIGM